jgi:hypothetical protein
LAGPGRARPRRRSAHPGLAVSLASIAVDPAVAAHPIPADPWCGPKLADPGADVIEVKRPGSPDRAPDYAANAARVTHRGALDRVLIVSGPRGMPVRAVRTALHHLARADHWRRPGRALRWNRSLESAIRASDALGADMTGAINASRAPDVGDDSAAPADGAITAQFRRGALGHSTLTTAFCGSAPQDVFGVGRSDCGRQAMMAGRRHPDLLDGIVAWAPVFGMSRSHIDMARRRSHLTAIAPMNEAGAGDPAGAGASFAGQSCRSRAGGCSLDRVAASGFFGPSHEIPTACRTPRGRRGSRPADGTRNRARHGCFIANGSSSSLAPSCDRAKDGIANAEATGVFAVIIAADALREAPWPPARIAASPISTERRLRQLIRLRP